ncbi:MAG: hypothetical protein WAW17_29410, partial [Rhodococcus sp. (in: high G+C Gram-positive bacteria)]|uniref:hypothetical protein n=1 Tax=Rhodococcus sp. TaxID=1831 RepID=UPI003BB147AB
IWQSSAAQAAQNQGQQAQASGAELSERGTDIAGTTHTAAASVARGNANLATISESFAATAVAAAPVVTTPPGQAMLLASAAEHIKAAIGVVTQTRTELNEQTLTMNGLAAPVPVPPPPAAAAPTSPFAIASTVMEGVGKPMVSTVTDGIGSLVSADTHAASIGSDLPSDAVSAKTAIASTPGTAGAVPGSVAIAGGAGIGMFGATGGGTASSAGGAVPRGPVGGAAIPPVPSAGGGGGPSDPSRPAGNSPAAMHGTGMSGMGGSGAAGAQRGAADEQLTGRSAPGYLVSAVDRNSFVGDLPLVAPAVIGGEEWEDTP